MGIWVLVNAVVARIQEHFVLLQNSFNFSISSSHAAGSYTPLDWIFGNE
jgi:hypothetical protein